MRDWLVPDGSLRDAYVFATTTADWQAFIDLVRTKGWWFSYSEDGRACRMPAHVEEIFARRQDRGLLLQIRPVPDIAINVHFFGEEEIEADFAPAELQGQERLDVLCGFLRAVGRQVGKPVVFTPENRPDLPIIVFDPRTDLVQRPASGRREGE
ncbi:hypothetical protein ACQEU3_43640 [Spirillospora sp. CA-253888]